MEDGQCGLNDWQCHLPNDMPLRSVWWTCHTQCHATEETNLTVPIWVPPSHLDFDSPPLPLPLPPRPRTPPQWHGGSLPPDMMSQLETHHVVRGMIWSQWTTTELEISNGASPPFEWIRWCIMIPSLPLSLSLYAFSCLFHVIIIAFREGHEMRWGNYGGRNTPIYLYIYIYIWCWWQLFFTCGDV